MRLIGLFLLLVASGPGCGSSNAAPPDSGELPKDAGTDGGCTLANYYIFSAEGPREVCADSLTKACLMVCGVENGCEVVGKSPPMLTSCPSKDGGSD